MAKKRDNKIIFQADPELEKKLDQLVKTSPYKISKSALLRLLVIQEYARRGLQNEIETDT